MSALSVSRSLGVEPFPNRSVTLHQQSVVHT